MESRSDDLSSSGAPACAAAPPGSSPLNFCLRLARAHAALVRRLDSRLSALHGLSFGDFTVLHVLGHAPGGKLRRVDLAERLGMTASGVTRLLVPLEKLGLVSRQPDPRDARAAYATLTAAGERLRAHAGVAADEVCREVTQAVPVDRLDELARLFGSLAGLHAGNR